MLLFDSFEKTPARIGFLSYQGGSGVSTLLLGVASRLHYYRKVKIVVIDCDSEKHSCASLRRTEKSEQAECEIYPIVQATEDNALEKAALFPDCDALLFDLAHCRDNRIISTMDCLFIPVIESHMAGTVLDAVCNMAAELDGIKNEAGEFCKTKIKLFMNKNRDPDSKMVLWKMVCQDHGRLDDRRIYVLDLRIPWRRAFETNVHQSERAISTMRAPLMGFMKVSTLYTLECYVADEITLHKTEETKRQTEFYHRERMKKVSVLKDEW